MRNTNTGEHRQDQISELERNHNREMLKLTEPNFI